MADFGHFAKTVIRQDNQKRPILAMKLKVRKREEREVLSNYYYYYIYI